MYYNNAGYYNSGYFGADVSSVGDGITFFGYKSSFLRNARCSCINFVIVGVILGIFSIFGIVMASLFWWTFLFFAVWVIIIFFIVLIASCASGYRRRVTEIYMNSQTKLLVVNSQRTPFCNCFGADQQHREFPLDQVQSIDQTPIDFCSRSRQVGFSVMLVTGESYSPIRPYFNRSDIGHLQEFLRNYKLGQIGAGPMPAAAVAAVANADANARAALLAYPPAGFQPQGYGSLGYPPPPQGYCTSGVGAPSLPQGYYAPPQGYCAPPPPPAGYSSGGVLPPAANTNQGYYGNAGYEKV